MAAIDSGDAFERVLAEAEARLSVVRRARARVRAARRAQVVGGAVALVAVAAALLGAGGPRSGEGTWIVVSLTVAALGLATALLTQSALVLPLRRQAAIDERIMLRQVNRLRELFAHIARREGWDGERIRATRQRLSRFPIEGGTFR
ncbi:hypothetical protein GCM10010193_44290 [Kitasatospora atroaurantiaca]|uniref:SMODS and SLOG-associating 2TM effector domain-containing protein n=1 Tax=Kitasatospora atroaurantiaca TaxID=285545 RepID=A0A561EI29_9ACTN|nr:hypothetical protein [Kitasatospora atroaurantiaca]TWE15271.1 hypothetical protein FB465_0154 [Kitasatospora atroaurantiaca]